MIKWRACSVEGCERKHLRKGYCDYHYNRILRKTDRPLEPERRRADWHKNKERYGAATKEWWAKNPEKMRSYAEKWRKEHPEERKWRNAKWRSENQEKHRENARQWSKTNIIRVLANNAIKRARKFKATPDWANKFFMEEAYDLASRRTKMLGFKWHVDHIVPLNSKIVCGLHVHNNLQVIPAIDNIRKNNRTWPDMP